MEVAVAEEKKKIFRARKTMKISDRQQLESLHSTLSSPVPPQSSAPPPQTPLVNGAHTADGLKGADKEQNDTDLKSSRSTSPVSQASRSPPLILTLSLSPSPPSHSSNAKEGTPPSPPSPFHSLNSELKRMEEEGRKECSVSPSNETRKGQDKEVTTKMEDKKKEEKEATGTKKEEACTTTEDKAADSPKDSQSSAVSPGMSAKESGKDKGTEQDDIVAMETDKDSVENKAPEEKSRSPKVTTTAAPKATTASPSNLSPTSAPEADQDIKEEEEGDKGEKDDNKKAKEGLTEKVEKNMEEKMQVVSVKKELKVKAQVHAEFNCATSSHPSSTSSSDTVAKEEKGTVSGQKRPISEGDGKDGVKVEREGKRQRVDGVELEAQLELKITANAGSRLKLEKVVQQLVEERLRVLQLTVFDQNLQELKDRVEKIDSATKHQSTLNTLQAKIARLAKKFGEANQASENKRKQEQTLTSPVAKTTPMTNTTPTQRLVRTTTEVKQTPTAPGPTNPTVSSAQPKPSPNATTTMVSSQTPFLQLIPTTSNTSSTLATVSSQSQTGTLLLKATSGSNMVGQGQPLLIQLPLSGVNGQPGTLVNIPVSSFAAVNSLNKAMTTTPGATYILKAAPSTPTVSTAVPGLQASSTHLSPAQVTLARAVYQGGAGGISTPSAGVSVTTARAPAMCAPVAGVVSSSSSSSVASGPAATGSAPPGTPSGTAMTSKTDNQATGSTPTKTQGPRLRNSFIDLTEDDDDVQVTGVSKAKVTTVSSSVTQRTSGPPPLISTPTGTTARASPQSSVSSPQLTVHHRPPLDSPSKARLGNTTTPSRAPSTALPPLPTAPPPTTRLPLEAAQTSAPQQPQLKLARVQSQNGIVLSWCVAETDRSCAAVESYHLYAYHQEASGPSSAQQHWKKIGEVKALRLPMACTLTQFVSGSTYYFAVRARDVYGRFGLFCEPQCTDVINVIPASS